MKKGQCKSSIFPSPPHPISLSREKTVVTQQEAIAGIGED